MSIRPQGSVGRTALVLIGMCGALGTVQAQQTTGQTPSPQVGQQTVFKSTVDLVGVDVEVVSRDGNPVQNLTPADFHVTINGHPREVVSSDFLQYAAGPRDPSAAPASSIYTPGGSDNAPAPPRGRIFVLAIDDTSFSMGAMKPALKAAQRFVNDMQPEDLVGLYTYPVGLGDLDLNHDHLLVERALDHVQGLKQPIESMSQYGMNESEVASVTAGDSEAYQGVVQRECGSAASMGLAAASCISGIRGDASQLGGYLESEAAASMGKLERLFTSLSILPYRKTVVIVSGGLAAADRVGGHPDISSRVKNIGQIAAAAGVNLYIVHMDSSFFDATSPSITPRRSGYPNPSSPVVGGPVSTLYSDPFVTSQNNGQIESLGLDLLANSAGGTLLTVNAGTGDAMFDRVLRETTSYYLLGVQPQDLDRDGKLHFISVGVNIPGATVRSRTSVIIPKTSSQ